MIERKPCKHSKRAGNEQGYPQIRVGGKLFYEHRYLYAQVHGPIPDGLTLDHLCHTWDDSCSGGTSCPHRRCVEVTHLEAVSMVTNVLRGRGPTANNARKTHCKRGHELTEENVYLRPDDPRQRQCRTCNRLRNKQRWAAEKAGRAA